MTTIIHQKVETARRGENPLVIGRVASGWAVMGDVQFLKGYCLVLADPVVATPNDLSVQARGRFFADMTQLGDILLEITDAVRINYEILGNLAPALHGHVFPRYAHEPDELRTKPVWFHDWDNAPAFDEAQHGSIRHRLRDGLAKRGALLD